MSEIPDLRSVALHFVRDDGYGGCTGNREHPCSATYPSSMALEDEDVVRLRGWNGGKLSGSGS